MTSYKNEYKNPAVSAFVAGPPDFLFFSRVDQVIPEIGMGNADQGLCPLPSCAPREVRDSILGDNTGRLGSRRGDNVAPGKVGNDIGMESALPVGKGGVHRQKGAAMFSLHRAGNEIHLASGS